jgi:Uma2 family endonuclease
MTSITRTFIEQTDPSRPPKETLPTMYDLPSEDPEEPGLPDEFHDLQPRLLSTTLRLVDLSKNLGLETGQGLFKAHDMNLYYDSNHPLWHKRPDWFAVVGVSRLYEDRDLRLSYVVWQEEVNPFIVVELQSPGTEDEDLGQTESKPGKPPTKWEVYERILRIPYYVLFNRYTDVFKVYKLSGEQYQELVLQNNRVWLPELEIGLGIWQGEYEGFTRPWIRWLDNNGNWIPTDTERFEQEQLLRQQAEQLRDEAQDKVARLAERLRSLGIDPEEIQ